MGFHAYMESQVPGYDALLDPKTITYLQDLYQKIADFRKAADYCMRMQLETKAGIDYSGDYNKNTMLAIEYQTRLDDEIAALKQRFGISTEEKKGIKK